MITFETCKQMIRRNVCDQEHKNEMSKYGCKNSTANPFYITCRYDGESAAKNKCSKSAWQDDEPKEHKAWRCPVF
jgi:hypothetical protein